MDKDLHKRNCLSDKERYADLINGLLLEGEQKVHPDDLSDLDSQVSGWSAWFSKHKKNYRRLARDLIMKTAVGVNFVVIGVENQEEVHYLMPVRTMSYDAAEYERQARTIRKQMRRKKGITKAEFLSGFGKSNRLYPCVTIVLYYGKEWDGARSLHEILDFAEIPSKLKKYINNYPLHVFEISKLENTDVFRTDLKQIFDYIRYSRDKKKLLELVQSDPAYQEMDEDAYDMAVSYTNSKELISVKQYHGKEGKVNMCEALTQLLADERQQGIERGIEQGVKALVETCQEFNVTQEETVYRVMKKFLLSQDESMEYVKKYWLD